MVLRLLSFLACFVVTSGLKAGGLQKRVAKPYSLQQVPGGTDAVTPPGGDNATKGTEKAYAYVTMLMNPRTIPSHHLKNTMTREQQATEEDEEFGEEHAEKLMADDIQLKEHPEARLRQMSTSELGNRAIEIAKELQRHKAKYPLVVLTNDDKLINGTSNPSNMIVIPINSKEDYIERKCQISGRNSAHFQKLQVFSLTQWTKMIWLDWDIKTKKNIDYLFEKDLHGGKTIYGQFDDWNCNEDSHAITGTGLGFCSGVMLFQPSTENFEGVMKRQREMTNCWGDQSIISAWFGNRNTRSRKGGDGRQLKVFDKNTVAFQHCGYSGGAAVTHNAAGQDPKV